MSFQLVEYRWNGVTYQATGQTFTFNPPPSNISKAVKCEWRVRHRGLKSELKMCKWRYRKTETFTLEGILNSESDRRKLEAFATRNSKFKFVTPEGVLASLATEDIDRGSHISNTTDCYVLITDCNFELNSGKKIINYKLTLERVTPP